MREAWALSPQRSGRLVNWGDSDKNVGGDVILGMPDQRKRRGVRLIKDKQLGGYGGKREHGGWTEAWALMPSLSRGSLAGDGSLEYSDGLEKEENFSFSRGGF